MSRGNIPKDNGKTRPIGVSALEDKIVQGALRELLEAIYEQDFLDCSYGFRPGRSAHAALARRIQGHFNYFGVNGNHRSLSVILYRVERSWFRWLRRRSQRTRMTWKRFHRILRAMPLPKVRVCKNLWAAS